MPKPDESDTPDAMSEESLPIKKPYQKPAFRHDRVFETMALACGKISTTQSQCKFNKKNS